MCLEESQPGAADESLTGSKPSRMPTSKPALFSVKKLSSQVSPGEAKSATTQSTSSEGYQTISEIEKDVNQDVRPVTGFSNHHISDSKQKHDDVQYLAEMYSQNAEHLSKSGGISNLYTPQNPLLTSGSRGPTMEDPQQQQELQKQLHQLQLQQQQQPPPVFNHIPPVGPKDVPGNSPEMLAAQMQFYKTLLMQQMLQNMPTALPTDGNSGSFNSSLIHSSNLVDQKNQVRMKPMCLMRNLLSQSCIN